MAYGVGNYVEVVSIYERAKDSEWFVGPTAEMTELYTSSKTTYLESAARDALSAFGIEKNYDAAIGVLRDAISKASSNEGLVNELEAMVNEYREYIPIALTTLSPTQLNTVPSASLSTYLEIGKDYWEHNGKDVNGKQYTIDYLIGMNDTFPPKHEEDAYVTYNLNYEYGVLSGVVFRPYSSLSCSSAWTKPGYLRIYGDDVLIYESQPVTQNTYDNEYISIDVSGVRNLKIVLVGYWCEDSYDCHGKVSFGDVMLQRRIADKHIVSQ
jgi:hypothetical protein